MRGWSGSGDFGVSRLTRVLPLVLPVALVVEEGASERLPNNFLNGHVMPCHIHLNGAAIPLPTFDQNPPPLLSVGVERHLSNIDCHSGNTPKP
ncbi:unknown [Tropheryma whipplei str. Twist]|uniref:Uncharacterized protein n=1 Tax=Tropheryma whipplei (strain Twist) TaxID=203267 RepID=Q83FH4_TROWT|nr:unknown [Tropheryma whipplei str. Twist]